jgi:hypothetical protein
MVVAKRLVVRTAVVVLAIAIVLVLAAEARALTVTAVDDRLVRTWINLVFGEYTKLGGFTPNSGKMMTGLCGSTVPIFVTNGLPSSLGYLENTSATDCTYVQLWCYSGDCTSGGTPVGQASPILFPKDSGTLPFRLFGFACPENIGGTPVDMICVTSSGSGTWRLQGQPW